MEWCCPGFKDNYAAFGKRGVAVLVQKEHFGVPQPTFVMQVKSVLVEDQSRVRGLPHDIPLSLVTEIGLQFCPWCGRNLTEFYQEYVENLHRPNAMISN